MSTFTLTNIPHIANIWASRMETLFVVYKTRWQRWNRTLHVLALQLIRAEPQLILLHLVNTTHHKTHSQVSAQATNTKRISYLHTVCNSASIQLLISQVQ